MDLLSWFLLFFPVFLQAPGVCTWKSFSLEQKFTQNGKNIEVWTFHSMCFETATNSWNLVTVSLSVSKHDFIMTTLNEGIKVINSKNWVWASATNNFHLFILFVTSGMCENGLTLRAADKELIDFPSIKSLVLNNNNTNTQCCNWKQTKALMVFVSYYC